MWPKEDEGSGSACVKALTSENSDVVCGSVRTAYSRSGKAAKAACRKSVDRLSNDSSMQKTEMQKALGSFGGATNELMSTLVSSKAAASAISASAFFCIALAAPAPKSSSSSLSSVLLAASSAACAAASTAAAAEALAASAFASSWLFFAAAAASASSVAAASAASSSRSRPAYGSRSKVALSSCTSISEERASRPIACPSTSATSATFDGSCRSMSSAMKNSPYLSVSTSDCALKTGTRSSWSSTRASRMRRSGRYSPRWHACTFTSTASGFRHCSGSKVSRTGAKARTSWGSAKRIASASESVVKAVRRMDSATSFWHSASATKKASHDAVAGVYSGWPKLACSQLGHAAASTPGVSAG